jgi:5-methylcytosine-specific restriction endonuclease McrA
MSGHPLPSRDGDADRVTSHAVVKEFIRLLHSHEYRDDERTWERATANVVARARRLAQRGTAESWSSIRERIIQRDNGICHVCGYDLNAAPQYYECGHIVDRVAGGSDLDENLVVMCCLCNRVRKPVHETREEYEAWLRSGKARYP